MDLKIIGTVLIVFVFQFRKILSGKASAKCPGSNWAQLDKKCYYFLSDTKTWNSAKSDCEARGGTLLIFQSKSEIPKVFKQLRTIAKNIDSVAIFWLGAHNQDEDRVFRWADGSDITYQNWKSTLEAATGGNCVVIKSEGSGTKKWELRECSESLPYVCEIQMTVVRWTGWSIWSECSASCGTGSKSRTRTCLRPTDAATGDCEGQDVNTKSCSTQCAATWKAWGKWNDCSVTCGKGTRKRSRICDSKAGKTCSGNSEETEDCQLKTCAEWTLWTEWGICSVTCDSGTRSRSRSCSVKNQCKGDSRETQNCRETECSAAWQAWGKWNDCSVTCGKGTRKRSRKCDSKHGRKCSGNSDETEDCQLKTCPAKCPGSNWAQLDKKCYYFLSDPKTWNSAKSDCETRGGTLLIFQSKDEIPNVFKQLRTIAKNIDSVAIFWLGAHNQDEDRVFRWVDGSDITYPNWKSNLQAATGGNCVVIKSEGTGTKKWELRECSETLPYVCEIQMSVVRWTGWSIWSECSVSCGTGSKSRTRTCLRPTDAATGDCKGQDVNTKSCSTQCAATWKSWGKWNDCSATCGTGTRKRSRKCDSKEGKTCSGNSEETENCQLKTCAEWTLWTEWTTCSVTCDSGTKSRSRSCSVKSNCKGDTKETKNCRETDCPATWNAWGKWNDCSVTCGKGTRKRSRKCDSKHGRKCSGNSDETEDCQLANCPEWTLWTEWSTCSVTCDSGTKSRSRSCSVNNKCKGDSRETKNCKERDCPATWKAWGKWNDCSVTCGKGTKNRSRKCDSQHGRKCSGNNEEMQDCQLNTCPEWTLWTEWSTCSVTCGSGTKSRSRSCSDNNKCKGDTRETKNCRETDCPATWETWGKWNDCSVTCGKGTKKRSRKCDSKHGRKCSGNSDETEDCQLGNCPEWTLWTEWSTCSVTCDSGTKSRSRSCSVNKKCKGDSRETTNCKETDCPASWKAWGNWNDCSVTCGKGTRKRSRKCDSKHGRKCSGNSEETEDCQSEACPEWTAWSLWDDCSVTCNSGTRTRSRSCPAKDKGKAKVKCIGEASETEKCEVEACPLLDEWSNWSGCSVTCGKGRRSRYQKCQKGKNCKRPKSETEACTVQACPEWGDWSPWSECSVTCDKGEITRTRSCSSDAQNACRGHSQQTKPCRKAECLDRARWSKWTMWSKCSVTCGVGTRTSERQCVDGHRQPAEGCQGISQKMKICVSTCKVLADVEELIRVAPPDKVKFLQKMKKKLSNTKLREEIFNAKDRDDWVIVGHEIEELSVDRPLTCARYCIRSSLCKSFSYEMLTTNGQVDLSVEKRCILNSKSRDEVDNPSLEIRDGFKLFDLEPFFI